MTHPASRRGLGLLLWILAVLAMLGAAVYQRATGPTYPLRVTVALGDRSADAKLVRSGLTTEEARVELPAPTAATEATLFWRRYPTPDAFEARTMTREGDLLVGSLPRQPAAGKVEYYVDLRDGEATARLPDAGAGTVVLRYKAPVPAYVLIPHIVAMFFAVLVGIRTGLAAVFGRPEMRRLAYVTFGLVTLGGMILGPITQKFAFGAYWTGWPNGYDLTDNKALIMWVVWGLACLGLWLGRPRSAGLRRGLVLAAAIVMLVVYLIPHSLRGSELDYDRMREGVAPEDAIRTG